MTGEPLRADAVASRLALPDPCALALAALSRLELDRDAAAEARTEDEHGRLGALSWLTLSRLLPELPGASPNAALRALSDWGLVQVVGQEPNDPVLLGSAACRLTYSGRAVQRDDELPVQIHPIHDLTNHEFALLMQALQKPLQAALNLQLRLHLAAQPLFTPSAAVQIRASNVSERR